MKWILLILLSSFCYIANAQTSMIGPKVVTDTGSFVAVSSTNGTLNSGTIAGSATVTGTTIAVGDGVIIANRVDATVASGTLTLTGTGGDTITFDVNPYTIGMDQGVATTDSPTFASGSISFGTTAGTKAWIDSNGKTSFLSGAAGFDTNDDVYTLNFGPTNNVSFAYVLSVNEAIFGLNGISQIILNADGSFTFNGTAVTAAQFIGDASMLNFSLVPTTTDGVAGHLTQDPVTHILTVNQ